LHLALARTLSNSGQHPKPVKPELKARWLKFQQRLERTY
jgi:hypothetical protein